MALLRDRRFWPRAASARPCVGRLHGGLTDAELPRYLLVSDFARFRLYDLEGDEEPVEFPLKELWKHIRRFGQYVLDMEDLPAPLDPRPLPFAPAS